LLRREVPFVQGHDRANAVDGFAYGFPRFSRQESRKLAFPGANPSAYFPQQRRPGCGRNIPPFGLGGTSGGDGACDVVGPAVGYCAENLQRRWIPDVVGLPLVEGMDPGAIDEDLLHDTGLFVAAGD
jgi:hypothetical protein